MVKNTLVNAGNMRDSGSVSELAGSLEEEVAAHSSILAWRIPMDRRDCGLWFIGLQ